MGTQDRFFQEHLMERQQQESRPGRTMMRPATSTSEAPPSLFPPLDDEEELATWNDQDEKKEKKEGHKPARAVCSQPERTRKGDEREKDAADQMMMESELIRETRKKNEELREKIEQQKRESQKELQRLNERETAHRTQMKTIQSTLAKLQGQQKEIIEQQAEERRRMEEEKDCKQEVAYRESKKRKRRDETQESEEEEEEEEHEDAEEDEENLDHQEMEEEDVSALEHTQRPETPQATPSIEALLHMRELTRAYKKAQTEGSMTSSLCLQTPEDQFNQLALRALGIESNGLPSSSTPNEQEVKQIKKFQKALVNCEETRRDAICNSVAASLFGIQLEDTSLHLSQKIILTALLANNSFLDETVVVAELEKAQKRLRAQTPGIPWACRDIGKNLRNSLR